MAWHSVSQAQKLTGKSRRTLYRDMASGRVSWRNDGNGHRELETSELIRVYGALVDDGTDSNNAMLDELRALRIEVADLKSMLLRLEHKEEKPHSTSARWWCFWRKY
ncbi:entry exclusion protein 1 [Escherichia coli]|nr:entry exclusion protein 1 [Escherichia coli]